MQLTMLYQDTCPQVAERGRLLGIDRGYLAGRLVHRDLGL